MSQNVGSIHYDLSLDTSKFDAASKSVNSRLSTVSSGFTNFGTNMMKAGAVMTGFSIGVALTGKKFVDLAGDLQTTQQRMASLAGSTEEAKRVMGELYTYVLGKPIAFPEASKAATTLMGYGVQANKVVEAMKTLSSFSIVNGADMQMLALAYGQVNAKGRLMGQEIIQLTNNFVPVSQIIAKHFNVSIKEAMELMDDGKITAEQFNAAMAGFIPQSEIAKQANTFKNRLISLQGSIRNFGLALLGVKMDKQLGLVVEKGGFFDTLTQVLPKISKFLGDVASAFKKLDPNIRQFMMYAVVLLTALGPLLLIIGGLSIAIGTLLSPISLVIIAITIIIATIVALQVKFKAFTPFIQAFMIIFRAAWEQLKIAFEQAKKALEPYVPQLIWLGKVVAVMVVVPIMMLVTALFVVAAVIAVVVAAVARFISWLLNLRGTVFGAVDAVIGAFNNMRNTVIGIINGMWGAMYNAGKNIIFGLARGISDAASSAVNSAKNVVSRVRNLLPFSPAKEGPFSGKGWTLYSGQSIMKGFAKGITSMANEPQKALDKALSATVSGTSFNVNATPVLQGQQAVNQTTTETNINGNIILQDKTAVDAFFNKLNRNNELARKGLATL